MGATVSAKLKTIPMTHKAQLTQMKNKNYLYDTYILGEAQPTQVKIWTQLNDIYGERSSANSANLD